MKIVKKIGRLMFLLFDKALLIIFILFLILIYNVRISTPDIDTSLSVNSFKREKITENHYKVGESWLKKNEYGVWEMYLEGSPYERGLKYGVLAKEIIESQEVSFVNQLNELIPSQFFQRFLQVFIAWFNRDMDEHIATENLEEIYGIAQSFSDKYNYIGPKFYRILYYHAAHDIGHALADLRIVGCSSFSANGSSSSDGELILGRNFDFYMGDDFAKDKLLLFIKPVKGYGFCSYSWSGFTGVVSGINTEGLTVTLNASKSDIPFTAKKPISLLAREILQYSKNIHEAVEIAKNSKTFVSESLMIGSANDNKTIIIEKGPNKMDVFDKENEEVVICSNHYQSDLYLNDPSNLDNIRMSDSRFRFERMTELINSKKPLDFKSSAEILRDKKGKNNKDIGLGNPKALNQLIAYHSVIFKPSKKKVWISTYPYQLGEYICYDLNQVFKTPQNVKHIDTLTVPKDKFVTSSSYVNFEHFRKVKGEIVKHVMFGKDLVLSPTEIDQFIHSNPMSYETYYNLGRYYEANNKPCEALEMFETSLSKVVASEKEILEIESNINNLKSACSNN